MGGEQGYGSGGEGCSGTMTRVSLFTPVNISPRQSSQLTGIICILTESAVRL